MGKAIVAVAMLSACVSAPRLTANERCARRGMVLAGVSLSSSGGVGVATGGGRTVVATSSSYGEDVICMRPATPADACEVQGARVSADQKLDFSAIGWNLTIGIGYVLFILPGVVMYFVADSQSDAVGREAERAGANTTARCGGGGVGAPGALPRY
jgi:hypothetical protein